MHSVRVDAERLNLNFREQPCPVDHYVQSQWLFLEAVDFLALVLPCNQLSLEALQ